MKRLVKWMACGCAMVLWAMVCVVVAIGLVGGG